MLQAFKGVRPRVDPTAYVHPRATLIGDVTIGPGASVWPGAVLRGDDGPIVIGEHSSIQDGTIIHATEGLSRTTVGARVTVGHQVVLHGCTIGDDCLIGMGSIVLDEVVVEAWAFVAAGTLVPPGKRVPSGQMMMGNPGKLVRALAEKDRAWITHSWNAYAKRAREYLAEADASRGA
ncbi:MAG: gamma carbonic anhydrase family protein [Myxococcales bacterium]|nr:gamma carbonic anhydrase family protein [Myxococcales bacterium]